MPETLLLRDLSIKDVQFPAFLLEFMNNRDCFPPSVSKQCFKPRARGLVPQENLLYCNQMEKKKKKKKLLRGSVDSLQCHLAFQDSHT